jgi:cytochrome c551/c552
MARPKRAAKQPPPPPPASPGRWDHIALAMLGVALAAATVFVVVRDARHDYRFYQRGFRGAVERRFSTDAARAVPSGPQQIWVEGLQRADRCITCHQGVGWAGFEKAEQPWRTHRQDLLAAHPPERFGCTVCHGGQGWALDAGGAHGRVAGWGEPLLDKALAAGLPSAPPRASLVEMNCNVCHRYEREIAGAPSINRAKALVREKGCRACHLINGRGGLIGPDLTWAGEKNPEQYDYSRLAGQRSVLAWQVEHFRDPRALVPDSVMPNFHLPAEDTVALAMLVMSWRRGPDHGSLLGSTPRADTIPEIDPADYEKMASGPGSWFVRTGCFRCHDVAAVGVKSPTPIGPDLSTAADDTVRRFNMPVDRFLRAPVGTMRAVLTRQIMLSPDQQAEAVRQLAAAYAKYQSTAAKPK